MATVKQCDRCGAVFKYDSNVIYNAIELQKVDMANTIIRNTSTDLCPLCMAKLKDFLCDTDFETDKEKLHAVRDILTAHPFVDEHPESAIKAAVKELDEVLDS